MSETHYYETTVTWEEGRIGKILSEGMCDVTVATPPEFPKGVPNIWSPEHLLVAAVNVCLMTTFLAIADNSKFEFTSFSSKAKGKLEKVDGKFMITEIELYPTITIAAARDADRVKRIVEKAENNCLISNSVKSKIILNTEVLVQDVESTVSYVI